LEADEPDLEVAGGDFLVRLLLADDEPDGERRGCGARGRWPGRRLFARPGRRPSGPGLSVVRWARRRGAGRTLPCAGPERGLRRGRRARAVLLLSSGGAHLPALTACRCEKEDQSERDEPSRRPHEPGPPERERVHAHATSPARGAAPATDAMRIAA